VVRPSSTGDESGHAGSEGQVAAPGQPPARRVSLLVLPASAPQPARGGGKALTVAQPETVGGAVPMVEELVQDVRLHAPDP
jgi:hypothetical protein